MSRLLICGSSRDKVFLERLTRDLRSAGIDVQTRYDLLVREETEVQSADFVVVCLSQAAVGDSKVRGQVFAALDRKKHIIPVMLDPCLDALSTYSETEPFLHLDIIDLEVDAYDRAYTKLLRRLQPPASGMTIRPAPIPSPVTYEDRGIENYLRRLHARIGFINLARVVSTQTKVPLELVYTPSPIELAVGIRVQNYRITEWWIDKVRDSNREMSDSLPAMVPVTQMLGTEAQHNALETIVQQVQTAIDRGIDPTYDNPTDRPLVLAPPWYDGVKRSFWPLQAIDAASTLPHLVLIGPPGSGKSTFARYLALCLLGSKLSPQLPNANLSNLGAWLHGPLTPLFIELRQLVGWDKFPKLGQPVIEDHFWDYVKERILGAELLGSASRLRSDLVEGRGIIILDGLDEVPIPSGKKATDQRRRQLQDLTRELQTIYAKSRIIFTSRDYAYHDWELRGFTTVRLIPLGLKQMSSLATRLYIQKGMNEGDARSKANSLILALEAVPGALKDYPLFITLMATLFVQGETEGLPTQKGALYHESIMLLLDRWTQRRMGEPSFAEQIGCTVEELYERLEVVAFKTQEKTVELDNIGSEIDFGILLKELFRIGPGADMYRLLAFLSQQAGVLVSPEPEVYRFAHRGFQEYLAASYMCRQFEHYLETGSEDALPLVREYIEKQPSLWREPCLLLGEILSRQGRKDRLWDLVATLLDDERPVDTLPADSPYWWSVWLAARIAAEHDLYAGRISRRYRPIYNNLQMWLTLLVQTPRALPTIERVEAGTFLGLLGDGRPGVGAKRGVPDITWVRIPEGRFKMGTTEEQITAMQGQPWAEGWTFTRETPATEIYLPNYDISRYPITYSQFQAFIDDPSGYTNPRWWTENGWAWFEEEGGPEESTWGNLSNLPRTNVSWYEAQAFCNWLSAKLECRIRLPSEGEWEKAARGSDGRLFPWGDNFESTKCNSLHSGIDQPAPVGCYLASDTPWGEFGPQDMSGNVWEWCTTICESIEGVVFSYPYSASDGREDPDLGHEYYRVVRGGSYLNPTFLVRTAYRGRDRAHHRGGRIGFRIVRHISPPETGDLS